MQINFHLNRRSDGRILPFQADAAMRPAIKYPEVIYMEKRILDFRSDTVTKPTKAMYKAMVESPLGDDVLGDDPTVQKLEAMASEIFDKEAAMYVPSGSMGNLISVGVQANRGDEVIMEAMSHTYNFEVAGTSAIWGIQARPILGIRGAMDPSEVRAAVRPESSHMPRTGLICVENTHNFHGGSVIPLENIRAIGKIARENGVKFHIDGARIFNASVASGVDVKEYAACADTVQFCLSKGLSSPVGSVVVGTAEFMKKARRIRKMIGGTLRQAGVLCGCGIVSLTEMVGRLKEDHANAKKLAKGLAEIKGVRINPADVETNIVVFTLEDNYPNHAAVIEQMKTKGLLLVTMAGVKLRMVTHKDVNSADVDAALEILAKELPALRK
jgi:threonine aldolase